MQASIINNSYVKEEDFPSGVYSETLVDQMHVYLTQLNETQLKAYRVAKRHLGSSFNLSKSNGFVEWSKARK